MVKWLELQLWQCTFSSNTTLTNPRRNGSANFAEKLSEVQAICVIMKILIQEHDRICAKIAGNVLHVPEAILIMSDLVLNLQGLFQYQNHQKWDHLVLWKLEFQVVHCPTQFSAILPANLSALIKLFLFCTKVLLSFEFFSFYFQTQSDIRAIWLRLQGVV